MAWIKTYEVQSGKRYRVYWREPDGKTHGKVFRRAADARSFRTSLEHDLARGAYTDPARGKVTLREVFEAYIASPPRPLAPKTRSTYRRLWRCHIDARLGDRRINTLEPEDIREFLQDLERGGIGGPTINAAYRLLRAVLTLAVQDRRIALNPVSGTSAPRVPQREMRFLSADELGAIAEEVPDRYRSLVMLLGYSGLRIGEASALRRRNVDLLHRRVTVVEAASEVDGVRIVGETKTRKKRSVAIPKFLSDELDRHLATYGFADPESLVFTTDAGTPISQHTFTRLFQRAAKRAGVSPRPRVHDCRHTAVALAIEAGAHPKHIQEMLGHTSITVTFDVYGHLFETAHEAVADRLDALYGVPATKRDTEPDRLLHAMKPEPTDASGDRVGEPGRRPS